jgi:hypothetical protein
LTALLIALVGTVSTLIGIVIGHLLSASRDHAKWVKDYKRGEYRELLDLLYQTVATVAENRPNLKDFNTQPVNVTVARLSRAFADRIFIADALVEIRAAEDWNTLIRVIYYDPELHELTPKELRYTLNNLQDRGNALSAKILDRAKEELVKFKFAEK